MKTERSKRDRGNYVSEWFGHRVYPVVVCSQESIAGQEGELCPFLSDAKGEPQQCVKSDAARGVCTISTLSHGERQDWLVCPYRALDPNLVNNAVSRLFGFAAGQASLIFPAVRLVDSTIREQVSAMLAAGGRAFIYFDEKLGGELSVPKTERSPEFAFDMTILEIELREGKPHIGKFAVIEIQTMDFHGSYRYVVRNLKDALRLHGNEFGSALKSRRDWLSEKIEGPNIANVFKRTFYQIMFKFQLGKSSRCAGCALAIPTSVWNSWQPHLGAPGLRAEPDGTFSLFKPGVRRRVRTPAWIYVFDLDAGSPRTPSPIVLSKIIATDAPSLSHFALDVAPAAALDNIASETGMLSLVARRLKNLWPELGAKITS